MMIDPRVYYEFELKDKSAAEIKVEIENLQRRIAKLEEIVCAPDYMPTICPSEDLQLSMNLEYLQMARKTLAEKEH